MAANFLGHISIALRRSLKVASTGRNALGVTITPDYVFVIGDGDKACFEVDETTCF